MYTEKPTRNIIGTVFFFQEWKSIEPDHFISDPISTKEVPNSFGH